MSGIEKLLKKMSKVGMIWDYAIVGSLTVGVSKDVLIKPTSGAEFTLFQL